MSLTHVVDLRVHQVPLPLVRPFVTAIRRVDTLEAVLVEARDSDGRSGWGEAPTSWRVTGESFASVQAAVAGALAPAVVGMPTDDPAAISRACARALVANQAARMAVDCAVYDLAAQRAGLPVWRYLGGATPGVPTDMTLSATPVSEALVQTARGHLAAGFTTLKIKVAGGMDTVAQLRAVRSALGPEVTLRVDANQSWELEQAVAVIDDLAAADLDVELVEQPTPRDELPALVRTAARTSIPIMADESVWNRRQLSELLAIGRVDHVNIKLAKTGGITEALALAALARAHGLGVVVGCMLESHVGIAAAASLAAALTTGDDHRPVAHDLDGGLWLSASPVIGGARYDGPRITLPDAPGFGIIGLARAGSRPSPTTP